MCLCVLESSYWRSPYCISTLSFYFIGSFCLLCLHENKSTFEKHFWLLQLSVYSGITLHFVLCFWCLFLHCRLVGQWNSLHWKLDSCLGYVIITVMSFVLVYVIMSSHILLWLISLIFPSNFRYVLLDACMPSYSNNHSSQTDDRTGLCLLFQILSIKHMRWAWNW